MPTTRSKSEEKRSKSEEESSSDVKEQKFSSASSSLHDGTELSTRSGAENLNSVETLSVSPKIVRGSTLFSVDSTPSGPQNDKSFADVIRLFQKVGIAENKRCSRGEKEADRYVGPESGGFSAADVPHFVYHFDSVSERYKEMSGEDLAKIAFSKLPTALKLRQEVRATRTWSELRRAVMVATNFNVDLELESVSGCKDVEDFLRRQEHFLMLVAVKGNERYDAELLGLFSC